MNVINQDPLLDRKNAAGYIGAHPDTLAHWAMLGIGPVVTKIGRSVRYRQSDLEAYLKESRVEQTAGK
jgi:hypothetical protein